MVDAARKQPPLMTTAEFLSWGGDGTDTKFELVEGTPRAMAPASTTHGRIHTNLVSRIDRHLEETRPAYQVVTAPGIQPKVRADWNHRIPELGVTCAPDKRGALSIDDPILLIEGSVAVKCVGHMEQHSPLCHAAERPGNPDRAFDGGSRRTAPARDRWGVAGQSDGDCREKGDDPSGLHRNGPPDCGHLSRNASAGVITLTTARLTLRPPVIGDFPACGGVRPRRSSACCP